MEHETKHPHETEQMPKQKNGKGTVVAIVVVIVLAIAALGGLWYYMNNKAKNDKKASDAQIQQLQKQLDELKKSSAASETADWLTYNDTYDGLSFKYPKDWKLTTEDNSSEFKGSNYKGPFINATITSPSGFKLNLVNHISGIGGSCGPSEKDCPQNQFISKEKFLTLSNGVELYLVKYQGYDASGKTLQTRKIGYIGVDPKDQYKQSFENYQGYPPYFYFKSSGADGLLSGFSGPKEERNVNIQASLTADQYFAQPDLVTAEKILKTLKQI